MEDQEHKRKYMELLEKTLSKLMPNPRKMVLTLQGLIEENYSILDVGCGMKYITRYLSCDKLIGVDIEKDYLSPKDVCGDIRKLKDYFSEKSFDTVICIDVIEHLTKEEGVKLLSDMESIARKKVIVTTPINWTENKESVEETKFWSFGNMYNYHKSLWEINDFFQKGYYVSPDNFNGEIILAIRETG